MFPNFTAVDSRSANQPADQHAEPELAPIIAPLPEFNFVKVVPVVVNVVAEDQINPGGAPTETLDRKAGRCKQLP